MAVRSRGNSCRQASSKVIMHWINIAIALSDALEALSAASRPTINTSQSRDQQLAEL